MSKVTFPTYEEAQKMVLEKGIKSMKEYKVSYKELGLPSAPASHYKDAGWIDWYVFLGTKPHTLPTYEEAQRMVQKKGIGLISEYLSCYKELGLPSEPHVSYKDKGWTNWYDFFGKKGGSYPKYDEAKRILQEKGINCIPKYKASYKDLGLPSAPDRHYNGHGWAGWHDFFDKERKEYPSYEEAKKIVLEKGIMSYREYKALYKKLGLPSAPERHYQDKGWTCWSDFFDKAQKISHNERKYKILAKLSITPILLQEDAPLQVIYCLVAQLDKKLAKEMEEILGTTSFEERLNWVKNQLKNLKEGTSPTFLHKDASINEDLSSKATGVEELVDTISEVTSPADELSAMESIIEVFDDMTDTLSEDVKTEINTIIENYLHNAVNKELVSEYDG